MLETTESLTLKFVMNKLLDVELKYKNNLDEEKKQDKYSFSGNYTCYLKKKHLIPISREIKQYSKKLCLAELLHRLIFDKISRSLQRQLCVFITIRI